MSSKGRTSSKNSSKKSSFQFSWKSFLILLVVLLIFALSKAKTTENSSVGKSPQQTSGSHTKTSEVNRDDQILASNKDSKTDKFKQTTDKSNHTLSNIPAFSGSPYVVLNNNVPEFTKEELKATESFEKYAELDSLGRCGVTIANVGRDIMPQDKRGSIGSVKPTGWQTAKYDSVDGKFLYNRCHLIGYQLSAENANPKNLITGTRYLNVEGMLPFENLVADYVKETGNHVLYRVTPIFKGDNLVANGVQMEAMSLEDKGEGVLFNVYCYNIQPNVKIDYKTGLSEEALGYNAATSKTKHSNKKQIKTKTSSAKNSNKATSKGNKTSKNKIKKTDDDSDVNIYVLNTKTHKFHTPDCPSAIDMQTSCREEYTGKRSSLIDEDYSPCSKCNP